MEGFLLSLSDAEYGGKKGKLRYLYDKEPFYFSDLTDAVLKMEEILDNHMPPRSLSPMRSFETSEKKEKSMILLHRGNDAKGGRERKELFYIQIYYRQNSSWQGEVRWQNGSQKMYFRSVLELLKLLDSACEKPEREEM